MGASTNVAPVIIKRKKIVSGGHHGGAWKVAYADFVTAMMAFFMLMWLLNATTENQRKGLADYFSPTIPINRVSGGGDGAFGGDSMFSEMVMQKNGTGSTLRNPSDSDKARGESGLDADGAEAGPGERELEIVEDALFGQGGETTVEKNVLEHIVTRVTDEGLVIEVFDLPGEPLFEAGTTRPTPVLREAVRIVARAAGLVSNRVTAEAHLRANPVVLARNPVWELSAERADVLRELLETMGMAPDRMARVTGHADRKLSQPRTPMSERNNRVEIILLRSDRPDL